MLKRTISGAVFLLVMFGLFYAGGLVLLTGLFVMSVIGLFEFCRAFLAGGHRPFLTISILAAAVYYVLVALFGAHLLHSAILYYYVAGLWCVLGPAAVLTSPDRRVYDALITIGAVVYIPMMLSAVYFLRLQTDGVFWVWFVVLSASGSDVFAYLVGSFLGRHKLCEKISPKKTVEGAIGGVVGAVILCLAYAICIRDFVQMPFSALLWMSALMGLVGSVLGQLGDLLASVIKRTVGIKDFGTLIPGHGGLLDRCDSLLLVAPVLFGIFRLMAHLVTI